MARSQPDLMAGHVSLRRIGRRNNQVERNMSFCAQLEALYCSTNPKDREELLRTKLMFHQFSPSVESQQNIASLVDQFELEEKIEKDDPVTFGEAINRVVKDADSLFVGKKVSTIKPHFFSSISANIPTHRRPTLQDQKSQWMTRWIERGTKRGVDEWIGSLENI
jgi:hypothetical protein